MTGGAGFIGANLVHTLVARYSARVTVADDFRSGHFANLNDLPCDVIACDVSRPEFSERMEGRDFDAIFHLASITDTTVVDQQLMVHDNAEGFRRVLDVARHDRVPVVYASSAAVYGIAARRNSEGDPRQPANVYGFSKVVLENIAREASSQADGWRIAGVRYFNVYGPGEGHKGKFASMIYQLYLQMAAGKAPRVFKMGEQQRDFVSVSDVVEGTIRALDAPRDAVYNLGSGVPRSFNDIIACLNAGLGTTLATEYIDNPWAFYQPYTEADLALTTAELGYAPAHTLESGIAAYLKWLQSDDKSLAALYAVTEVNASDHLG